MSPTRPLSIAHRGASAYARPNSVQAFEFAAILGADMWEVDLRITSDRQVIVFHDAFLEGGQKISDLKYAEIEAILPEGVATRFSDVLTLAKQHGAGIYADIKAFDAAEPVCDMLRDAGIQQAILGAFDASIVTRLGDIAAPYPRAILVPVGVDPFEIAGDAEIIHLCWEKLDRPQDLLDRAFFERCDREGKKVVLWHEEDPARMADLRDLPVLGICSDQPQLVNPFEPPAEWPVEVVCHRGANAIAPENSHAAASACFIAGFSHVEIDVHVTGDGELVVMHDRALERTSNGEGLVTQQSLEMLRGLSVGSWFSDHYSGEVIPTLSEVLELARGWNGKLYVELKTAPADLTWECVSNHQMRDNCFFWSFDAQLLRDLRALSPDARIMMRRQDFDNLDATLESLSPSLIEFTHLEDLSELSVLRELNVSSMVAYNGREASVFRDIARHRPDLVNLHCPFEFVRTIFGRGNGDD